MSEQSSTPAPNRFERILDRPLPRLNAETVIFCVILLLAIFSRFYLLGDRVMSHDEINHVVPAWNFYEGRGYTHDPMTHGPLQFHLMALSYSLFGDTDAASRVPDAVFSVLTVLFVMLAYRRYLGRTGALVAGALFLISPLMLFYGRYTRNEVYGAFFAVAMLYLTLRYLEEGQNRHLLWMAAVTVLSITDKATGYIFTAELMIFLAVVFMWRISRRRWVKPGLITPFVILLVAALGLVLGGVLVHSSLSAVAAAGTTTISAAEAPTVEVPAAQPNAWMAYLLVGLGLAALAGAAVCFVRGLTWRVITRERSFDLIMLLGTLILPLLASFVIRFMGWNPLDYSGVNLMRSLAVLGVLAIGAGALGMVWKPRVWLYSAGIFYAIFFILYTSLFTNSGGVLSGLLGQLGYWLEQQGVARGGQPWYVYVFVELPMYEYLAVIGTLLTAVWGLVTALRNRPAKAEEAGTVLSEAAVEEEIDAQLSEAEIDKESGLPLPEAEVAAEQTIQRPPVLGLLLYWSAISLVAFTLAGEKMGWLTVHIIVGMLLAAGWSLGRLIDATPWTELRSHRGWLAFGLLVVFLSSTAVTWSSLTSGVALFQGNEINQLQATAEFVIAAAVMLASLAGLTWLLRDWNGRMMVCGLAVVFFALLAVLTARSAVRAAFINQDNGKEFLVYAHGADGPKYILTQVEEISYRLTGGQGLAVAYDNDSLYPFWWYFRDYPNKVYYADQPTKDLLNSPVILVGQKNFSKVEPIVRNAYVMYEYPRIVWPNQDYFNLTWDRVRGALADPAMRNALWEIWFNRDYTEYAAVTGKDSLTEYTWAPSEHIRMYVRKDLVSLLWSYGVQTQAGGSTETYTDPYEGKSVKLEAAQVVGAPGSAEGQFQSPRSVAAAPDGTLYVADSKNNRIQHLAADGTVLGSWGTFGDALKGEVPGGQFSEPWGVAVGPDGSVYVADTWNSRIQKFTADGRFLKMWGVFGTAETPGGLWGPRGIAVDGTGRVFVTDTGNKRVVIYSSEGQELGTFGSVGMDAGQFNEPVGIAIGSDGRVYVADTWNQRVQVFAEGAKANEYTPVKEWSVEGWYGDSLENKPYLAVTAGGQVLVSDPEAMRVIEFDANGALVRYWGDAASGGTVLGMPVGLALDAEGALWVADAGNNNLVKYVLP